MSSSGGETGGKMICDSEYKYYIFSLNIIFKRIFYDLPFFSFIVFQVDDHGIHCEMRV